MSYEYHFDAYFVISDISLEATRIHIAGVHPTSVSYVVKLSEHAGCNFPTEVYNFIWLQFHKYKNVTFLISLWL